MAKLFTLLLLLFFHSVIGHAAGFDCSKSDLLSPVEKLICSDAKLSEYEERLNNLFHKTIMVSTPHEQRQILDEQLRWLIDIRNRCDTWFCLHSAYQARLNALSLVYQDRWQSRISGDVLLDLLRHSTSSAAELKEILSDCPKSQTSMNFCSFRSFVKADLEMSTALANKLELLPLSCREQLQTDQAKWAIDRDNKCNKEADDTASGSSRRPMIFTTCQAETTEQRTEQLELIKSCGSIRQNMQ